MAFFTPKLTLELIYFIMLGVGQASIDGFEFRFKKALVDVFDVIFEGSAIFVCDSELPGVASDDAAKI